MYVAKTKVLISCMVTAGLFGYAKSRLAHDTTQLKDNHFLLSFKSYIMYNHNM